MLLGGTANGGEAWGAGGGNVLQASVEVVCGGCKTSEGHALGMYVGERTVLQLTRTLTSLDVTMGGKNVNGRTVTWSIITREAERAPHPAPPGPSIGSPFPSPPPKSSSVMSTMPAPAAEALLIIAVKLALETWGWHCIEEHGWINDTA